MRELSKNLSSWKDYAGRTNPSHTNKLEMRKKKDFIKVSNTETQVGLAEAVITSADTVVTAA